MSRDFLHRRQERLRRAVSGGEEPRLVNLPQATSVGFESDAILSQRLGCVFHRQRLAMNPHGGPLAGQPSLGIESPVVEPE